MSGALAPAPLELSAQTLHRWPLPCASNDADKEARGNVLIVAGSREIPGAAVLAATAALRAGAGKLQIATAASVAQAMAFAMPEARVLPLQETEDGGFTVAAAESLKEAAGRADAVLIGPGMQDEQAGNEFVRALLPLCTKATVVLDAQAMNVVAALERFERPVVMTPHAGEMAHLRGEERSSVEGNAARLTVECAGRWNAVVALKGATTCVAAPDGTHWCHVGNLPGLGTSGSGDTLAGIIAGLAARGADAQHACLWGVVLHAQAGRKLAERIGPLGFLAREIADEIPGLLHALCPPQQSTAQPHVLRAANDRRT